LDLPTDRVQVWSLEAIIGQAISEGDDPALIRELVS
jgi:hypothetical protein